MKGAECEVNHGQKAKTKTNTDLRNLSRLGLVLFDALQCSTITPIRYSDRATMSALARYLQKQPDFKDPSSSSSPLPALYADLAAHKSSNRSSYEASVDWWARLLFDACLVGAQSTTASSSSKGKQNEARTADRLVLHLDQQLIEECTVDEVGRPLGLGTVAVSMPEMILTQFVL